MQRKISDDNPVGFNAILLGLISRFFLEVNNSQKAELFWKKFEKVENEQNSLMSEHPEVIFCKAFSLFASFEFFPNVMKDPLQECIELYKMALKNNVRPDWLYELCLAMEQNVHQPDNDNNDKLKDELETTLRQVIEMDPKNCRAKIKLARLLVNKDAVEEAKFFIDKVDIGIFDDEGKILKDNLINIEMLGFLYMIPKMSKLKSDHLETATVYFSQIISLNQKMSAAHYGLGKW